jgi:serine/threonine protein kinase/Flp pilus assembly protein TadD
MPATASNEEAIFHAALALDDAGQRSAYLDEACSNQPELRRRVEALLCRCAEAQGPLDRPVPSPVVTTDEPIVERPGAVFGPYKLLEQIGEGGFGIVFMAEQQEPIRRKVALKVLKPGMDTRQVIARFEAERQALALMDHPNIARVLDAGATETGRPYFVMELVRGIPITDYCDQNQLTPRERLDLFLPVCQAVQHAHQKGIIHRDIKPSNVLVTLHDGTPVPKIIDFGIAKALGQQLTDKTLYTGFAQMIGTPLYMSPEQAEMSGLDVDTRSDIYSLGVLLYELLTGATPFDKERFKQVGYDEMRRIIREEEPPRPSTRISTLGEAAATVSTNRKSDPKRLSHLLRGELDWIVMKCLEKDRNRRYATVSAFTADVLRYLNDEPVQACPPSLRYRLRKLARRNKTALAIAACLFLVLAIFGGGVGWVMRDQAERAAQQVRELEKAEQEAFTLRNELIAQLDDPEKAKRLTDDPLRWEDLLHAALGALQRAEALAGNKRTAVDPRVRARLSALRSELEIEDRDREMAVKLEEIRLDAIELHAEARSVNSEMAKARGGWMPKAYRKAFEGYGIARDAMAARQAAARINRCRPPIQAILVAALADWFSLAGDDPEERDWLHQTVLATEQGGWWRQAHTAFFGKDRAALQALADKVEVNKLPPAPLVTIARCLDALDRGPAALRLLRRAQSQYPTDFWVNNQLASALLLTKPPQLDEAVGFQRVAAAIRPKSSGAQSQLCAVLIMRKDWDGAIAAGRRATELQPGNHRAHLNFGSALHGKGDLPGGIAEIRQAIEINPEYAMGYLGLGRALRAAKDWPGAFAAFEKASELFSKQTTNRQVLAGVYFEIGITREESKDLPGAIAAYEKALEYNPKLTAARGNLGKALKAKGDLPRAIAEYRKLIAIDSKDDNAYYNLGNALKQQRDFKSAIAAYREAIKINSNHEKAYHNLGVVYFYQNKWAEAIDAYRQALAIDPNDAIAHNSLGNALKAQGHLVGAIDAYRKSIRHDPTVAGPNFNLGQALEANKDLPGAIAAYREAVAVDPKLTTGHLVLGRALYFQHDLTGSIAALSQAIALDPKLAEAHNGLGLALKAKGDLPGAITAYRKAVAAQPTFGVAYKNLGQALEANKDLRGAIAAYARAAKLTSEQPRAGPNHWTDFLSAAALLAKCATLAEKDGRLAPEKRSDSAEQYARQAVDMLRQAIANGYKDTSALRQAPALAVLRSREDFQKLLAEFEGKAKP